MNRNEKELLSSVEEKVAFCIYKGIDNEYIANELDNIIYNLSEGLSAELFNALYRIQDNLLMGNDILNIF